MTETKPVLTAHVGLLQDTLRNRGAVGLARKILAAVKMNLPLATLGRRTHSSVGAFYDLVTDEARLFYGDSFHFGYFRDGVTTLTEAVGAMTELVGASARLSSAGTVVDLGCGVCGPASHLARLYPNCRFTGVNISAEQVRQGRELVAKAGLSDRIDVREGNALKLPFEANTFDSALSLEVAANVCVESEQKLTHITEMFRVVKPGGHVGFADLVFNQEPTEEEDRVPRRIFFHKGSEYMTDWPALFTKAGFVIEQQQNVLLQTQKTWELAVEIYERRADEVNRRYGRRIATETVENMRQLPKILERYGSYLVLSARKPE